MHARRTPRPLAAVSLALAVALTLGACGGGSGATASPAGSPSAGTTTGTTTTTSTTTTSNTTPSGGACAQVSARPGLVSTAQGGIEGTRSGDSWAYLGIPFAAPPVGPLRWQPPSPPACFNGTFRANAFAPPCPQTGAGLAGGGGGGPQGREDCLYLNAWTPAQPRASGPLPVMVFIHGGGNVQGSTSERVGGITLYDGADLAAKGDVVVVTIAYRVGALGFLAHPALAAESPRGASGNYGLLDQLAGLQWVQRNVAAFGGDPARVLLFGESAGAVDTCALLVSPLARGLFSRALMESGACVAGTKAQRETEGQSFAQKAGCATASAIPACLRALTPEAILAAVPAQASVASAAEYDFGPTVDGYVLPGNPRDLLTQGKANPVPLVVGNNSDETSFYLPRVTTCAAYESAVRASYPVVAPRVLAQYPCATYPSPLAALTAVTSDARFVCTARLAARAAAKGQGGAVFRYEYSHASDSALLRPFGAFHGSELALVFQHRDGEGVRASAATVALSDAILRYWTRFAATGDPNGGSDPAWPRYDATTDRHLELGDTIAAKQGLRSAQCDFWETIAGISNP